MRTIPPNVKYRITAGAGSSSKVADKAMGKIPAQRRGRMNKTEAAYALWLDAGKDFFWMFEAIKLKLADKTYFTPDFVLFFNDKHIEFHEIKGFERDDAIVKFKCAAEKFHRFRFKMVKRIKGEWIVTRDSWA